MDILTPTADDIIRYPLTSEEVESALALVYAISEEYRYADISTLVDHCAHLAYRLPKSLVSALVQYRQHQLAGGILLTGFPIDDALMGPTPLSLQEAPVNRLTTADVYVILLGSLLGDPFSWKTLQNGALLNSILPTRRDEKIQSGGSSRAELDWHIEDAFHEWRADYLLLLGIRNAGRVPTTFASIRTIKLESSVRDVLRQRRFIIRPDGIHLRGAAKLRGGDSFEDLSGVESYGVAPNAVSVLFGDLNDPYLRINPPFMSAAAGDLEAEAALRELIDRLDTHIVEVPIQSGDLLVIDNYLAVHGRRSFNARYDGSDRWARKLLVTRDIRKSRAARRKCGSRVLN